MDSVQVCTSRCVAGPDAPNNPAPKVEPVVLPAGLPDFDVTQGQGSRLSGIAAGGGAPGFG